MALRPSSVPQRVALPSPPASSLPDAPDLESDLARAASPTVTRLLATVVTDPEFESTATFALVTELVDFVARSRVDYVASLVTESEYVYPPSVGGEHALGCDVLEERQFELECLAAALPRFASMLLCPEGDPDALDIPTPRSYEEAITDEYSFQWKTAMDAEMASWKVKRPPGSPPAFKARYVARGFSQRQGGTLDKEIWLRHPTGFTGSFLEDTQWSLQRPVYSLRQAPCEWHDTLRTTLAALGFTPSTADPSLFLCNNPTLTPFYILMYIDDLVFTTADTEALTLVKAELQKRHTCTDLGELRSYLGLQITRDRARCTRAKWPVSRACGCLMYLLTCTRPDLAYPLSILVRFVAPGRHRKEHWTAAQRVLRYLCSTLGIGLVLGGRGPVVLTGHSDASRADNQATQWSSQGYSFSLGSGSVSWRYTCSSSMLGSSYEAEIYAGAMAAQEFR
ncbi:unnamed protein product [Closterium sp. NIES-53]